MKTQKIVTFLNGSDNENSKNLGQKNGMLLTVNQKLVIQAKMKSSF